MSLKCGLLGEKLGHSMSPRIHAKLGEYEYLLYEKMSNEVEEFLLHGDYDVLNVTIPYKKVAFGLCIEVTPIAAELGNVNVVVKRMDGTLFGDNTDAAGFVKLVEIVGADVRGKKCVVLGTGGAAMTSAAPSDRRSRGLGDVHLPEPVHWPLHRQRPRTEETTRASRDQAIRILHPPSQNRMV